MTAIAGCISTSDMPVDQIMLQHMTKALSIYGSDDSNSVVLRGAGFARNLLRINPEDLFDRQPLHHTCSGTVVLFDGRLDNRAWLARVLDIDSEELVVMPDSHLVLLAFLRFGERAFEKLLGDFCVAVWEQASRRLVLARDPVGSRPLFWSRTKDQLAFATMPKALFKVPGVSRALSEEGLHDYMCMIPVQGEQCFFRDIHRLEPGCVLILKDKKISRRRYQSLFDGKTVKFQSDDDYVDAFAELFECAVASRLRGIGPISSQLSGGFDSGTVTAVAARFLENQGKRLTAYTSVPRHDVWTKLPAKSRFDESAAAACLAAHFSNIDHELVAPLDEALTSVMREEIELLDSPPLNVCGLSWLRAINQRVRENGSRVLLTGILGNATISHSGDGIFTHLLSTGHLREWFSEALSTASNRNDMGWGTVMKRSVLPFLPSWVWVLQERLNGRNPSLAMYSPVSPALSKRLNTRKRCTQRGWDLSYKPAVDARKQRCTYMTALDSGVYFAGANAAGLEWRDPTADLRVIQFCLSVPEEQYWRRSKDRWLLRRYLERILPEDVINARVRGVQAADWGIRLKEEASNLSDLLESMSDFTELTQLVDLNSMRQSLSRLKTTKMSTPSAEMEYKIKLMRGLTTLEFIRYLMGVE